MSIELKVKANSLAAEARIIRKIEKKLKENFHKASNETQAEFRNDHVNRFNNLHNHKTASVRKAARSTHLARMYIKGLFYSKVEAVSYERPDYISIAKMVRQYGGEEFDNITRESIVPWAKCNPDERNKNKCHAVQ